MAREINPGLSYFPLDVVLNDKFELIEAKHGIIGFGVIIKLYQNIYRNSYYQNVTDDWLLVFKKRIGVNIETLRAVIKDAVKWGIFNEKLFETYSILTSLSIQRNYIGITKRRKNIEFIKEYLLVSDVVSCYSESVNVCINSLNVTLNTINADTGTQSKVKKRKVEKNKEEKKEKKKLTPPTQSEVVQYFLENGYTENSGIKAFKYYSEGKWKDSRGQPVRNWKQKMRGVWFKDENFIPNQHITTESEEEALA
jgi:uncharacterized protein DUF4373